MSEGIEHVERGLPRSVRRTVRLFVVVVSILTILAFGSLVIAGAALRSVDKARTIEQQIQTSQSRANCRTQLQADFEAAVGLALGAPPAPNPARDQAVATIKAAARRLQQSEKLCS